MGGAETLSLSLVNGFEGITTTVVTQAAIAEHFTSGPAKVRLFEESDLVAPYDYRPRNALRYAAFISKIVTEERPDTILGIMQAASIFLALASITHPVVLGGIRRVGSVHGHIGEYFKMLGRSPTFTERFYLRLMASRLDRIVVPSRGVKDDLAAMVSRARPKIDVIYNGIRLTCGKIPGEQIANPLNRTFRLIMTARLSSQKDHRTLLKAFAKLRESHEAELLLVGDGEERASLENLTKTLGVTDSVTFTGQLADPLPLVASADVALLISRFEGFGLAILEAMAMGRAVIATDCPSGPSEIICDGVDGYLVPPGDPDVLVEKLKYLLDNADVRNTLGQKARVRVMDFSREKMIDAYRRVLFA
jgi:glycosyltransferase involved in cell wall biosynthesis